MKQEADNSRVRLAGYIARAAGGRPGRVPLIVVCLIAVAVLVPAGIAYRALEADFTGTGVAAIDLPVPLDAFPQSIDGWKGQDLPLPATTLSYMEQNFADDFISRRYILQSGPIWADLYLVYCASRPSAILGHQPRVCYPGGGWVHESTDRSEFKTAAGQTIPCLVHWFHKPAPAFVRVVVLNFYVVNGRLAIDEDAFGATGWRTPNIAGDPARYVAQVQISSTVESNARKLATAATDTILGYLPDEEGKVRARQFESSQVRKFESPYAERR